MDGLKIAALYGLKPHELGFCGPEKANKQKVLRKFLEGKISSGEAKKVLKQFEGAFAYYKLIAKCNGIKNPFAENVVLAYWIGNKLLDKVKIQDLKKMIENDFSKPKLLPKEVARIKANSIPPGVNPHHSFHVFIMGSVTGKIDLGDVRLKDFCRISWGKIIKIAENKLVVEYNPIVSNKGFNFGKKLKKEIVWDKTILPKIKKGDIISFHWGLAMQILNKKDVANLKKYTLINMRAIH